MKQDFWYQLVKVKKCCLAIMLAWLALFLVLQDAAMANGGFMVGPSSVNISLQKGGIATTNVYITSSFDGELIVGAEDLPLTIEPKRIEVSSADNNKEVQLSLSGDSSLAEGQYLGKITFLTYSGNNVAYGVKIKANVSVTDASNHLSTNIWVKKNPLEITVIIGLCLVAFVIGYIIARRRNI